jgi:hypothetical protein
VAVTLAASYPVYDTSIDAVSLVTGSFTPVIGEIMVVKAQSTDVLATFGTPSGGGFTFTQRVQNSTSSYCRVAIWTAPVTANASMTVTLTQTGNEEHSMIVERWSNAQLAGTPAVGDTLGTTPMTGTITTAAAGSVVTWAIGDWNGVSGASRTYNTSSATPAEDGYSSVGGNYTAYYAYQTAATAASQNYGMATPNTGTKFKAAAVEIQAAAATGPPQPPEIMVVRQAIIRASYI